MEGCYASKGRGYQNRLSPCKVSIMMVLRPESNKIPSSTGRTAARWHYGPGIAEESE